MYPRGGHVRGHVAVFGVHALGICVGRILRGLCILRGLLRHFPIGKLCCPEGRSTYIRW